MYIFSFGSYSLGPLVSDRILTVRLATHAIVSAAVKTIAEISGYIYILRWVYSRWL